MLGRIAIPQRKILIDSLATKGGFTVDIADVIPRGIVQEGKETIPRGGIRIALIGAGDTIAGDSGEFGGEGDSKHDRPPARKERRYRIADCVIQCNTPIYPMNKALL